MSPPLSRGGWQREAGATLRLAWPLILSNLASTGLATIDVLLIGRLGPDALAAAALATNLFNAVLISSIGLVSAVSPLVAAEHGRDPGGTADIRRTVRQGFWLAGAICGPAFILLWQGEILLRALGQRPELAASAGLYLRALQWSLGPTLAIVVMRTFMASLGRPGWGLAISLAALPANGILAWALIGGHGGLPELGLIGAGIATTITGTAGFVLLGLVAVADRGFRPYRVFHGVFRPDGARLLTLARLGLPIAGTLALEVAFFSGAGFAMGLIGTTALAAHAVALQISGLCFMVPLGVAQAATIRVGFAFGAGDRRGVALAGWTAFAIAMGFMAATASILVGIPGLLVGIFLDPTQPDGAAAAALAIRFLVLAALFQVADGAQVAGAGMLRGLKDTRLPLVFAAIGYWAIGAPLGLALAFAGGAGGTGIWIGLAAGLASVALMTMWRWAVRERLGLLRGKAPSSGVGERGHPF